MYWQKLVLGDRTAEKVKINRKERQEKEKREEE